MAQNGPVMKKLATKIKPGGLLSAMIYTDGENGV